MKRIFIFLCCLLAGMHTLFSQTTPRCTSVASYVVTPAELTPLQIAQINSYYATNYPNATILASSTFSYNCHSYAWNMTEGGPTVWINTPGDDLYWTDGSYGETSNTAAYPAKVSYASDDHSAVTTSTVGIFISKWGNAPLMQHAKNYVPYDYSNLKYYTKNVVSAPITGDAFFCTSASYSMAGLPGGTTVTWSASPAGIVSLAPSGSNVTATKIADGAVTLIANVSYACGGTALSSRHINVGVFPTNNLMLYNDFTVCANQPVSFGAFYTDNGVDPGTNCSLRDAGATYVDWQISASSSYQITYNAGMGRCFGSNIRNGVTINFSPQNNPVSVVFRVQNACGWSDYIDPIPIQVTQCGFLFAISPNPSANLVNIGPAKVNAAIDQRTAPATLSTVKLYDNTGNLHKQWKFAAGSQQAQINVSGIKAGVYTIEISDGKNKPERHQLVITK
jgi:hypothetical protein